jgi:hypothetical protein
MAKAIHWPLAFREVVLEEDTTTRRCALRLGSLYFDHQFWVPGEVVDIRVNHLKVRKAEVVGELKLCRIDQLTAEDFAALKPGLDSVEAVVDYLARTYERPVTPETEVTVVYYRNHPIDWNEVEQPDDPHHV